MFIQEEKNRSNFISTFNHVDEISNIKTIIHYFQQENIHRINELIIQLFKNAIQLKEIQLIKNFRKTKNNKNSNEKNSRRRIQQTHKNEYARNFCNDDQINYFVTIRIEFVEISK